MGADFMPSRRDVLGAGAALAVTAAANPSFGQPALSEQNVVLITGTSSGFGRLAAETFARNGMRVVATMRDAEGRNAAAATELHTLAEDERLPLHVVEIDVTDQASVDRGVAEALRLAGGVDVLINNAGIVVPGPVELQPVASFDANIETNLHGALRVFRALAPHMRERGRGHLIQMSSALGRILDPNLGGYCALKLGVEAAADAIAYENAMFGIEVTIVQPAGAYPTSLQANALRYFDEMVAAMSGREASRVAAFEQHIAHMREGLVPDAALDPQEVVDAMLGLMAHERGARPRRLIVGPYRDAIERLNRAHDDAQAYLIEASGLTEMIQLR